MAIEPAILAGFFFMLSLGTIRPGLENTGKTSKKRYNVTPMKHQVTPKKLSETNPKHRVRERVRKRVKRKKKRKSQN